MISVRGVKTVCALSDTIADYTASLLMNEYDWASPKRSVLDGIIAIGDSHRFVTLSNIVARLTPGGLTKTGYNLAE